MKLEEGRLWGDEEKERDDRRDAPNRKMFYLIKMKTF